jgi:hypothetical protein
MPGRGYASPPRGQLPRPFIAYQKAPASDGDAATVEAFARAAQGGPQIIGRYFEAPGAERPELGKALEIAKQHLGALILPALDHIAGDAAALAAIQQSGLEFVACDQPQVSRDALAGLLAAAQALPPQGVQVVERPAVEPQDPAAKPDALASVRDAIRDIQRSGATTLRAIAKALQDRGVKTPGGQPTWHATQVARMMD